MADNNITPSNYSPALNAMGEAFERAQRTGQASTQTPVTPPEPPKENKVETPPVEPPKAEVKTESKPEDVKVPETVEKKVPLKAEDWDRAKEASYKRGKEEALAELKAKYISREEYDERIKELETYRNELRTVALDHDPEFRKQFELKRNSAISMAKSAAGEHAAQLEELLKLPPSSARDNAIDAIMENLSPARAARITGALGLLEQAELERQEALKNADGELRKRHMAQEQERQQRELKVNAERQKAVEALEQELSAASDPENGVELFREKDGDTKHNEQVNYLRQLAKHIFGGAKDIREVARAAVQAAAYKPLLLSHNELHQENAKLRAELDKLRGKKPGAGSDAGAGQINESKPQGLESMMSEAQKRGLIH